MTFECKYKTPRHPRHNRRNDRVTEYFVILLPHVSK